MTLKRRHLLATLGTVGSGLVAGCMGEENNGGNDPSGGDNPDGGDSPSTEENGDPEFPTDDIVLVIPYGSGGYDDYTRLIAPYIEKHLPGDVDVIPQNIEGAGGQIATEEVYRGDPDGYTHLIVNFNSFTLLQLLEDVSYDLRDLTYFAQVADNIGAIGVGEDSDISTYEDYVEAVQNEEVTFATTSLTGGSTLIPLLVGEVGEQYDGAAAIQNHVMYDGRGEELQAILGGDAHVMAGSYSSLLPYVESGDIRVLLTLTTEDEPYDPEHSPDAETLETASIPNGEEIISMEGSMRFFAGPPEVPDSVTNILRETYHDAINDDEFLEEAEEIGRPISYAEGESVTDTVETGLETWEEHTDILEALVEDRS